MIVRELSKTASPTAALLPLPCQRGTAPGEVDAESGIG
jgi:hypothetical protein